MEFEVGKQSTDKKTAEADETRRDAVLKLGKFAAYAAPFTVLAMTKKADAATGSGPRPLPR